MVVLLGDIGHPCVTFNDVSDRLKEVRGFMENKKAFYILGDKDLLYMKKTYGSNADTHDWFSLQRKALRFSFSNNSAVLVVHGGILPTHKTWNEVQVDNESAFVSYLIDTETTWHHSYDGRFGYIASSHTYPGDPTVRIYNHSISLDTECYKTDVLAAQIIGPNGLCETLYV